MADAVLILALALAIVLVSVVALVRQARRADRDGYEPNFDDTHIGED